MDLISFLRILFPIFCSLIILFVIKEHISVYKHKSSKGILLNFTSSMILADVSLILFSLAPLVQEGDIIFSDIVFGGSTLLLMLSMFLYTEYLHSIYKKIPWFSDLFYLASGATFVLLLYRPWELKFNKKFGYVQNFTNIFLIVFLIEATCLIVILSLFLFNVKKTVDQKLIVIDNLPVTETDTEMIFKRKITLLKMKKNMNFIFYSVILGLTIAFIGFFPNIILLDSLGLFIAFIPQAYFISKNEELLFYFLSQKIEADAKTLQKNISLLHQSAEDPINIKHDEIKGLLDFIEKIDTVYYKKL